MNNSGNEKWIEQIQNVIARPKTILILGLCFFLIPLISVFSSTGVGIILLTTILGIVWFFPYRQPAFQIVRLIGNREVPPTLEKHKLKYYHFISLGIKISIFFYMYYIGIKNFLEKNIENLIH